VVLSGCASEGINRGGSVLSDTLTVYSLLPDPRAPVAADIVDGEKLALAQAGGRAGGRTVNFVSLEEGADGKPGEVADATRDVISDTQVIAVIGGLDSAGTRTSAPLFNEAGLLQVGLGAGYPGLTRRAGPDEPARYQPSAHTTFARVIGDDVQQAGAIVAAAVGAREGTAGAEQPAAPGGKRWTLAIESEGDDDSQALAQAVERAARAAGGRVVDDARDADALVYAGSDPENAAGVADGWAREAPDARIVLPDAVVRAGVAERLSPAARKRARLVSSAPAPQSPQWRRFAAEFRRRLGHEPGPYAAVGYEAMRGVLTALDRAGTRSNQRQRVIDSYLSAPERASLLGPLKVDARGDRIAPRFTIERP